MRRGAKRQRDPQRGDPRPQVVDREPRPAPRALGRVPADRPRQQRQRRVDLELHQRRRRARRPEHRPAPVDQHHRAPRRGQRLGDHRAGNAHADHQHLGARVAPQRRGRHPRRAVGAPDRPPGPQVELPGQAARPWSSGFRTIGLRRPSGRDRKVRTWTILRCGKFFKAFLHDFKWLAWCPHVDTWTRGHRGHRGHRGRSHPSVPVATGNRSAGADIRSHHVAPFRHVARGPVASGRGDLHQQVLRVDLRPGLRRARALTVPARSA